MPTDTKQLTSDEVVERLNAIRKFYDERPSEWRGQVANDLNLLVDREVCFVETHGYSSDYAASVLRIVERVAEFENIERKTQ